MPAQWSFLLTDAGGNALAELTIASGRSVTLKRNSYTEVQFSISHEDDAAALLLSALSNTGIPKLRCYRRGVNDSSGLLKFRGPLAALQEQSEESSTLTATFRSPFSALIGDGDKTGRLITSAAAYAQTDAGLIAKALIDLTNADGPTWIATDPSLIVATKIRDRTYPVATNVGKAIQDLTSVLDGFDFYESFVDGANAPTSGPPGAPTGVSVASGSSGFWAGPSATFFWTVTAVVNGFETIGSSEVSMAVTNGSGRPPLLTWSAFAGATSYAIYRSAVSGGETSSPAFVASVLGAVTSYTDVGSPTTTGAAPASPTTQNPDAFFNVVPSLGNLNPGARFEYGPGTLSNVRSLSRTTTPPINCVFVTGGNGLTSTYIDSGSVTKYGKWWGKADFPDVIEQATLDDKAKALCRPNPIKTMTFVPELALSPVPFDDWNLGDTVPFFASRSALSENTQLRINAFTIPIDDNGFETVETPDMTSPEEDAVIRASLTTEVIPS